ncbi:MAG: LacI family DNA-binding transcriptional regulator, partial [Betaproteobacteria bacterium]
AKSTRVRHAATLADVGRAAGVSVMAASAVLNGAKTSSRISDETRERILAAAVQLRYRANATARALVDRRMNTIGVATTLSRNELNQYFLEVFNGVIEAAAEAGQNTTVFALPDWKDGASRIPGICDGRIDGLILLAPLLDVEAAKYLPDHTPIVSVHANNALPNVVNLESDEETGAFEMVRHMLAQGHRRILHIAGPTHSIGAMRRISGYLGAHAAAGVEPAAGYIVNGEYTTWSGFHELEAWLKRQSGGELPQAIFAGSDAIAIGCLDALAARGYRTPADISVVGFDDTLLARSAHLATVRQPLREMGQRAVKLLVDRIEAKHQDTSYRVPNNIVLPTEVVLGQSLATPRGHPLVIS